MLPKLQRDQVVIAIRKLKPRVNHVVVASVNGREVIKRLTKITGDQVWIEGDNPHASTDSRHYGWVSASSIKGRVIYPRHLGNH